MDTNEYGHTSPHELILNTEQRMDLMDLNLAFIDRCITPPVRHEIRRPPPCGLRKLDARAINRLAGGPFALFRIDFLDRFASAEPSSVYRERGLRDGSVLVLLAATFCRSIAGAGSETSSLVLGVDEAERRKLLACSINTLRAKERQGKLRLHANFLWTPVFWHGLVKSAREPGEFVLKSTRLQGMQLLAAAAGGLHTTSR